MNIRRPRGASVTHGLRQIQQTRDATSFFAQSLNGVPSYIDIKGVRFLPHQPHNVKYNYLLHPFQMVETLALEFARVYPLYPSKISTIVILFFIMRCGSYRWGIWRLLTLQNDQPKTMAVRAWCYVLNQYEPRAPFPLPAM